MSLLESFVFLLHHKNKEKEKEKKRGGGGGGRERNVASVMVMNHD